MNPLNPPTPAHPINSNAAPVDQAALTAATPFPFSLLPEDIVFTVVGQVHDWRLGWAGRIEFGLRLSIGDLVLHANRDSLPLEIGNGTWIRIEFMHRRNDGPVMHVLRAAALAQAAPRSSEHDRSRVTLASLLWDIGKVSDGRLREDCSRGWPELQPHVTTRRRLKRPLELLAQSYPALARELSALLDGAEGFIAPITTRTAALRRQVPRADYASWEPIDPSLVAITTPGAQA